jgi:hypothetical protein
MSIQQPGAPEHVGFIQLAVAPVPAVHVADALPVMLKPALQVTEVAAEPTDDITAPPAWVLLATISAPHDTAVHDGVALQLPADHKLALHVIAEPPAL